MEVDNNESLRPAVSRVSDAKGVKDAQSPKKSPSKLSLPNFAFLSSQSESKNSKLRKKMKEGADLERSMTDRHQLCRLGYRLLVSKLFELIFVMIIMFNMLLVIIETDAVSHSERVDVWVDVASWAILLSFVLEMGLRMAVFRCSFWKDQMNVVEFLLVAVDLALNMVNLTVLLFGGPDTEKYPVSFLRVIRLCKLARIAKVFKLFPELRMLMAGLMGSFRAIFWGAVLVVFLLVIWSVIAVQFINPLNEQIAEEGRYIGCDRCGDAYSSVWNAFVTLFQHVVAGDSWGTPTVTVILRFPMSGLYFGAVFVTVGLAALNLILGIVVEVASTARQTLIEEIEDENILDALQNKTNLLQTFESFDEDGNGEISKAEFDHALSNNDLLRNAIAAMEVSEEDINILWNVLDSDRSGSIDYTEFATNIHKMQSSNTSFTLAYVKHYVTEIKHIICASIEAQKQELLGTEARILQHKEQDDIGVLDKIQSYFDRQATPDSSEVSFPRPSTETEGSYDESASISPTELLAMAKLSANAGVKLPDSRKHLQAVMQPILSTHTRQISAAAAAIEQHRNSQNCSAAPSRSQKDQHRHHQDHSISFDPPNEKVAAI